MPGLALLLLALYGLVAIGLRVLVQLVRTGSTGFKGVSGAPGSVEWLSGLLFPAAIALCVTGAVLESTGAVEPVEALDGGVGRALGVGLAVAGTVMTLVAQLAMGDAWRIGVDPGERTELVTRGPFAVVRNPIYAAMIPTFAGIALLAPNTVTVAGAVLLAVSLELQTRLVEEPHLLKVHGDRYAAYAGRVGRFAPGLGRLSSREPGERSRRDASGGR